jgi:hypothetical protein
VFSQVAAAGGSAQVAKEDGRAQVAAAGGLSQVAEAGGSAQVTAADVPDPSSRINRPDISRSSYSNQNMSKPFLLCVQFQHGPFSGDDIKCAFISHYHYLKFMFASQSIFFCFLGILCQRVRSLLLSGISCTLDTLFLITKPLLN